MTCLTTYRMTMFVNRAPGAVISMLYIDNTGVVPKLLRAGNIGWLKKRSR